jgi:hypothetical protein
VHVRYIFQKTTFADGKCLDIAMLNLKGEIAMEIFYVPSSGALIQQYELGD